MARIGKADREHSGHYLMAVAAVTVVVAALAWFSQNRALAIAAALLGLYALHLLSIRFLLDNQRHQREVLDAQWEVLQRFLDKAEVDGTDRDELVPPMPIDREDPESPAGGEIRRAPHTEVEASDEVPASLEPVVVGRVVPPAEALPEAVPASSSEAEPEDEPDSRDPEPEFLPIEESDEHLVVDGPELVGVPARPRPARPAGAAAEVPVPRHFALGTVALVRDLLTPAEVARVLLEQRRQPGKKFGELAVEMGLLNESQREELLLAQQEGLFTDAEMREARRRLREFRESAAHSMAGLD